MRRPEACRKSPGCGAPAASAGRRGCRMRGGGDAVTAEPREPELRELAPPAPEQDALRPGEEPPPAAAGCCPCPLSGENPEAKKKVSCPGLGLFYTLLSAFLFSVASLFVKKVQDLHSAEISAFRCVFQMLFIFPFLIYKKTGFLGPKGKRIYLFLRGVFGASAMILLYYAFQSMTIADATVITFTSPVFTSLFAWIFLKEKYSLWDLVFTLFAIAGVVLIARPPFLFGSMVEGMEGSPSYRLKGVLAAVGGAICGALTLVILRKVGKSVHYLLNIWYYAVIGLLECIIVLFILDEWRLPHCGLDRLFLLLIGLFGLGGQIFLTKAVQIEKAGPVAIMKTMDVVFAFILQIIFLNKMPNWWTVSGALCVVASSSGAVIRKWCQNSQKR